MATRRWWLPSRLRTRLGVLAAVPLLVVAGCGTTDDGSEPEAAEPDLPEPTEAPDVPETEEPAPDPDAAEEQDPGDSPPTDGDVLTEDDDGATVALDVGEEVPLRLSNDWLWDEPRISGGAVELAPVDYFADPGFTEWAIMAVGSGSSEVTAAGEPNCGDPGACPPQDVTIRLEVN